MNHGAHRPALAADLRKAYARMDVLSVLTSGDLADYGRDLAGAPTRVVQIPNAVPPLDDGPPAALDAPLVIAAGRLTRQKGFDLLIDAWAPLARRHPDWRLRIHGSGQEREALQRQIDAAGLGGAITLAGPTKHLGRRVRGGVDLRAVLPLRGLRDGARRGDGQGPPGRRLRLPARAGRHRHARPRRPADPGPGRRRPHRRAGAADDRRRAPPRLRRGGAGVVTGLPARRDRRALGGPARAVLSPASGPARPPARPSTSTSAP